MSTNLNMQNINAQLDAKYWELYDYCCRHNIYLLCILSFHNDLLHLYQTCFYILFSVQKSKEINWVSFLILSVTKHAWQYPSSSHQKDVKQKEREGGNYMLNNGDWTKTHVWTKQKLDMCRKNTIHKNLFYLNLISRFIKLGSHDLFVCFYINFIVFTHKHCSSSHTCPLN